MTIRAAARTIGRTFGLGITSWAASMPASGEGGAAYGAILATPADHCCLRLLMVDLAVSHRLSVAYADGVATMCVDGVCDAARIDLGPRVRPELLCVAVDPGEPGGDTAVCRFGNIHV